LTRACGWRADFREADRTTQSTDHRRRGDSFARSRLQEACGREQDRATTLSALESLRAVKPDVIPDGVARGNCFSICIGRTARCSFPFPKLIDQAETTESTNAFVLLDDGLYAMAVTPLLAPDPIAWLCPGFRIDDNFAREIKSYAHAEITF
jgi:hypothetical protein